MVTGIVTIFMNLMHILAKKGIDKKAKKCGTANLRYTSDRRFYRAYYL